MSFGRGKKLSKGRVYIPVSYTHLDVYKRQAEYPGKDSFGRNRAVLQILVEFGADPSILYVNKPHIGTDVLSRIVKAMRREIQQLGGQVRFLSRATDFVVEEGRLKAVVVNGAERIHTRVLVTAIGHSARDTFEVLWDRGIPMEAKAFAVGLRVQHPQTLINMSEYRRLTRDFYLKF